MKATDKNKLIDRIKSVEGLTDDERAALLGLLNETKTYGLVWEDKPEEVEERLRSELPVLKEVKSRAIISDNADAPNHILIEGDNLEALTTLAYTHEGKIDVIYIDPPYNTGKKKEFKYNDDYIDKENPFRHSIWLSFIKKRLIIAKKLLSEHGVIFLSIDDHELSSLKLLCDEIFSNNFIENFVVQTDGHTDNQDEITGIHEYILCYSKRKEHKGINNIVDPNTKEDSKILRDFAENSITKNGAKNPPSEIILPEGFPCEIETLNVSVPTNVGPFLDAVSKNGFISRDITSTFGVKYPVCLTPMIVENGVLSQPCTVFSGWMNNGKLKKFINNNCLPIQDEDTMLRFFLSKNGVIYYRREGRQSHYVQSILRNFGTTETNKYMLERMGVSFEYPKPVELIKYVLSLYTDKNSKVLDFFGGSGTTMHAVNLLNSEDGGARICISCTNDENGICSQVHYPRIKYILENDYSLPQGEQVKKHNSNLRYYRTNFVGRRRTPQNMRRLMLLSSDMLCIKENLYTEHDMFEGIPTLENGLRYFADGKKQMLIVYNEEAIYDLIDAIENMDVKTPIIVYVFSPGNDAWNVEFESVSEKVRLTALPAAIYNAYKRVLPKPKNTLLNPENEAKEERLAENLFDFEEEEGGEE
ncbi:MAG: site-specific DNA-methyltransferase [Bacteroidales bacterium]|nr:site-specific DNA-methyltransferase [Bacteroidales bacterium]